jgi:hypothetical protein
LAEVPSPFGRYREVESQKEALRKPVERAFMNADSTGNSGLERHVRASVATEKIVAVMDGISTRTTPISPNASHDLTRSDEASRETRLVDVAFSTVTVCTQTGHDPASYAHAGPPTSVRCAKYAPKKEHQ